MCRWRTKNEKLPRYPFLCNYDFCVIKFFMHTYDLKNAKLKPKEKLSKNELKWKIVRLLSKLVCAGSFYFIFFKTGLLLNFMAIISIYYSLFALTLIKSMLFCTLLFRIRTRFSWWTIPSKNEPLHGIFGVV